MILSMTTKITIKALNTVESKKKWVHLNQGFGTVIKNNREQE